MLDDPLSLHPQGLIISLSKHAITQTVITNTAGIVRYRSNGPDSDFLPMQLTRNSTEIPETYIGVKTAKDYNKGPDKTQNKIHHQNVCFDIMDCV